MNEHIGVVCHLSADEWCQSQRDLLYIAMY